MTAMDCEDSVFTCLACQVTFNESEHQRAHYTTDWHRYNLRRKVAGLPPAPLAAFESRIKALKNATKDVEALNYKCTYCNKSFKSANAYNTHIRSKKHLQMVAKIQQSQADASSADPEAGCPPCMPDALQTTAKKAPTPQDIPTTAEEMLEEKLSNAYHIAPEECLFCRKKCSSMENAVKHMAHEHGFFIPDVEYLVDLSGMLKYLAEKIGTGNVCIYCNDKGRGFNSCLAVQNHMVSKDHCKFDNETFDEEFGDFYDFTSQNQTTETNEDGTMTIANAMDKAAHLSEDGAELILPTGKSIGTRSLSRYYKQKFKPEDQRESAVIARMMHDYRLLGHATTTKRTTNELTKMVQRQKARHYTALGTKANKLFVVRPQVMY